MELLKLSEKELKKEIKNMHPYDLAQIIEHMELEDQIKIYELLDSETKSEVMSYLEVDDAVELFNTLELDDQKEVLETMEPDDAVNIVEELEETEKNQILEMLDQPEEMIELLGYLEDVAGAYMTNDYIHLTPEMDVKEATKYLIKQADQVETINTLFVVEKETNHYLGVIPFKKLIKAKSPLTVNDLIEEVPYYYDQDPIEKVIKAMRQYSIYETPILNKNQELIGMITMDDALDIYQEEAQEDYEKLAALPETEKNSPILRTALRRLPWLVVLLILSIPIAYLTTMFEEVLAVATVLALFQPLILDAGGDVATQTLAVTLISINNPKGEPLKNGGKEILTGIINGFVMGVLAFVTTYIILWAMQSDHLIAFSFVVSISLWITVSFGPVIGLFVPYLLNKMKFDPAVASGPFITTLIDIISLIIFFGLATVILQGVLL